MTTTFNSSLFKHFTPVEIRFVDIDAFGHVNNANYLTYIEQARFKYFNDIIKSKVNWTSEGLILANAKVDFLRPIQLNDKVDVGTKCTRIGNKSFELEYEITRTNGNEKEIVAKATTVLVAFNYLDQKSIVVPDSWKKDLSAFEGIQA